MEDYYTLLEDLLRAYRSASKHKRWKRDCMSFDFDYEEELCCLARQIMNFSYEIRPTIRFIVCETVYREVIAANFRDRIVHHYICHYLEPYLESLLIADCYSCRRGKGTSYGINRLEHHIRSASQNYTKPCYILQLDISAYFMSINKHLLLNKAMTLMLYIKQKKLEAKTFEPKKHRYILYLLDLLIMHDSYATASYVGDVHLMRKLPKSKSLVYAAPNCGLPIGNLTSQLFSNLYMNDFDHYVKRVLKVKHYGRYVDDFFIIDDNQLYLCSLIEEIRTYLKVIFSLNLHPKKVKLQEVKKGATFLGIHLKPYRRYLSNSLRKRLIKKIEVLGKLSSKTNLSKSEKAYIFSAYASYLGILSSTSSYRLCERLKLL